ncbi:MAG TPA: 16S rRNA (uracil(1498)-N(3))-methyltransferase [Nocardioides sp.]|jgi:16S rRNA (uracil1498-N3)-methyltransferase|nr:16S rRNA (uracil(1498)-N(3))-methyltransferase [uncultured Nocardioides sp.]HEX5985862.1 16S rRNA (uracil(1498)-N(3))-methyltransferase [Nocardioides sp.]
MTDPVFVHPGVAAVTPGQQIVLDGEEARHAVVVKRIRVGERIVLTDGAGASVTGVVAVADKSTLTLDVDEARRTQPELPRVVVVQAIPKGDRGELAVEMLTEVGVDEIVPWAASRCVAVWKGDRAAKSLAKWRATARESAKQARRTWFPEITDVVGTEEVAKRLEKASVPVVLHEAASGPLADLPVPGRAEIVIVVGPEGGISDEELAAFAAVGAEPVRLGSSVLRTSTAGVAATAALLARTRWR